MPDYAARRTMMVDTQVRPADVTKYPIIEAMLAVPREVYLPDTAAELAYVSENVTIAPGRVMLEPRTMGKMLDALDIQPREMVLDLGCGLGYSTALMAQLADTVVAVESDEEMAAEAQRTLSENGIDNAAVFAGPLTEGAPKHGPYDVIMVQGGVEEVPQALIDQLREGGRIGCVFMEGALGVARVGLLQDGHVNWRYAFNAAAPVVEGFEKAREFVL